MTFEGSCNRDLFEVWLEECLLPQLQAGDVIVIDNASFTAHIRLMKLLQRQVVRAGICLPILHAVVFGQSICPEKQQT